MKDSLYPYAATAGESLYRVYATVFSLIVGLVIFGLCIRWLRKDGARQRAEEEARKVERLEALRAQGLSGEGLCIVCARAPATEKLPAIVKSGFDRDPFGIRKLHGLTPMYVVKDDEGPGTQACLPCKRTLERKKEHRLQSARLRIAEVNAEVEADIARYESGQALAEARDDCQRARRQIERLIEPEIRQLPASTRESMSDAIVTLQPPNGKTLTDGAE